MAGDRLPVGDPGFTSRWLRIPASLPARFKNILIRLFVFVTVYQLLHLFPGLLFIPESGEQDPDIVNIILEICRFIIFDEHDLATWSEVMFFALPGQSTVPSVLLSGQHICLHNGRRPFFHPVITAVAVREDKLPLMEGTSGQDFESSSMPGIIFLPGMNKSDMFLFRESNIRKAEDWNIIL